MPELRISQLYVGTITSASFVTVYTVAAGRRVILKSIQMRNNSSNANHIDVAAAGVEIFTKDLAASGGDLSAYEWQGWIVLGVGQTIRLASSQSGGCSFIVSGTDHYV